MARLPTCFIAQGGGPWPWLPQMRQMLRNLETSLARMPEEIGEVPKAVLMILCHWGDASFGVMSAVRPGMVYD